MVDFTVKNFMTAWRLASRQLVTEAVFQPFVQYVTPRCSTNQFGQTAEPRANPRSRFLSRPSRWRRRWVWAGGAGRARREAAWRLRRRELGIVLLEPAREVGGVAGGVRRDSEISWVDWNHDDRAEIRLRRWWKRLRS